MGNGVQSAQRTSFMKRLLLALVPWMAMTSAARAQAPADVVFTHHGVISQHAVRVDDECFVPLAFLDEIGWKYASKGDSIDLRVDDDHFRVALRDIDGDRMIELRSTLDKLGGET